MESLHKLNLGIVGACGRGASFRSACEAAEIVNIHAVCDINEKDLLVAAEQLGTRETYTDYEAMHRLQALGVPATAVLDNAQIVRDPHLRERGFCVEDNHPRTGKRTISGPPWRFDRTPGGVRSHAPLLGEHNREIFGGLLGMTEDEIDGLTEKKVID